LSSKKNPDAVGDAVSKEMRTAMPGALLEEQFRLSFHGEIREVPIYSPAVDKPHLPSGEGRGDARKQRLLSIY